MERMVGWGAARVVAGGLSVVLVGLMSACGGGAGSSDLGNDLAAGVDAGVDLAADLAGVDAASVDLAQADLTQPADLAVSGGCSFVLSNAVGTNATIADISFPLMIAPGKGMICNDASGPTTCSVAPNGMTNNIYWTVYAGLGTLVSPVTVPFISSIAAMPDTAIFVYVEGAKRWTTTAGGSFTLDGHSGHSADAHFLAHMQPDPNGAAGATGTFDITATCTGIDFRP